jgi:CxxC motif-containing protein (DUF1111 family)
LQPVTSVTDAILRFTAIVSRNPPSLPPLDIQLACGFGKKRLSVKGFLAIILCLAIPVSVFASDNSYKVTYDGGSVPDLKTGTKVKMYIEGNNVKFVNGKNDVLTIPAASITEISYGQDVHRRIGTAVGLAVVSLGIGALTALSKSKKHYVGITWADGDKKGGLAMQCDKNDYRGVLAGLEGVSGKKAVNSDNLTVKN